MKKTFFTLTFAFIAIFSSLACTSLLVGKKASVDGSVMITYSADAYDVYGELYYNPKGKFDPKAKMEMYDWETGRYLGPIQQVAQTNNMVGYINDHQLCLGETTFGGRPELQDTTGIMDYGNMIFLALQRAKTAREAIKVMTDLVEEYGYYSSGESFSIADKNEIWIMEMIGKGVGRKGAVWVAVRIPDDCIAAHANQSRIHQFPLNDPENCIYSKDVISFAREMGYYSGSDKDFSFANAYNPLDWGGLRFCEARVWAFYNKYAEEDAKQWIPYVLGQDPTPMPLYVKPKEKISLKNVMDMMRDHYEGTPFDPTQDIGAGPYHSPYRFNPLSFELDGKKYGFERPISTQQTAFSFVGQMRNYLPDEIGGVLWFGTDDANLSIYTPMYGCMTNIPDCYRVGTGDMTTFSWQSSFWINNWVANMTYPRYNQILPDIREAQKGLEGKFLAEQNEKEKEFAALLKTNRDEAIKQITNYSIETAQAYFDKWKKMGEYIIVKYADGVIKKEETFSEGEKTLKRFKKSEYNGAEYPNRPLLDEEFLRQIIREKGDWLEQKDIKY
ncbi:C69 family dipeptidase [Bacteroidales bacterium OttesenSCG-928-M06]|nr:C69 family dipeptidase [Bacteroidales bacterium OttesenSCG-928-M06]